MYPPVAFRGGSSPHARGLLVMMSAMIAMMWIIPARAGFTSRRLMTRSNSLGSSPHARGLPRRQRHVGDRTGIIPARAGFTSWSSSSFSVVGDHPRTRGVYPYRTLISCGVRGSSPHARGLPPLPRHARVHGRIIPARAGFTVSCQTCSASARGSSPHARGLRVPGVVVVGAGGIIPARAGFTHRS